MALQYVRTLVFQVPIVCGGGGEAANRCVRSWIFFSRQVMRVLPLKVLCKKDSLRRRKREREGERERREREEREREKEKEKEREREKERKRERVIF